MGFLSLESIKNDDNNIKSATKSISGIVFAV